MIGGEKVDERRQRLNARVEYLFAPMRAWSEQLQHVRIAVADMQPWGKCDPDRQTIFISEKCARFADDALQRILLHEMAHALSDQEHGPPFARALRRLASHAPAWLREWATRHAQALPAIFPSEYPQKENEMHAPDYCPEDGCPTCLGALNETERERWLVKKELRLLRNVTQSTERLAASGAQLTMNVRHAEAVCTRCGEAHSHSEHQADDLYLNPPDGWALALARPHLARSTAVVTDREGIVDSYATALRRLQDNREFRR